MAQGELLASDQPIRPAMWLRFKTLKVLHSHNVSCIQSAALLGIIVMLSSSDCINLSSTPHAIQRIAPRAISQWQLIIVSREFSVGGRELRPPNKNLSVFQHRVSMSNTRMKRYRKF